MFMSPPLNKLGVSVAWYSCYKEKKNCRFIYIYISNVNLIYSQKLQISDACSPLLGILKVPQILK